MNTIHGEKGYDEPTNIQDEDSKRTPLEMNITMMTKYIRTKEME